MGLTKRSVRSVKWNTLATLMGFPLSFIQSVVLVRWLPVEAFGTFAAVNSIISLSSTFFEFGLSNAYIHRAPEMQDEEHSSAVYFTLRLIFDSAWAVILLVFSLVAMTGLRQLVLIFLVITGYLYKFTAVPQAMLIRRVNHRRLAVFSIVANFAVATSSIAVAWFTRSIWALLVSSVIMLVWGVIAFYIWKPFWRPRLAWDRGTVRYFLGFGSQNLFNGTLDAALDNSDNLWTGYFLGDQLLGYYSRAFRFAIYPRILFTTPINSVAVGTFAELKFDRLRLSKAFFRTSVLLTRIGCLLGGLLTIIAPQFITIIMGEKWLPMLVPFRLMLIFSLLDPIRVLTSSVLLAVGKPEKVTQVRVLQLIILFISLFALGFVYGINGVALSMSLMIIVGVLLSLHIIREYVDFSTMRLFGPPFLALMAGIGLYGLVATFWNVSRSSWLTLAVNTLTFCFGYLVLLFALEGKTLYQYFLQVVDLPGMAKQARRLFRI